ncbi:MAG: hypothetical protein M3N52_06535 [Actinomycetota bacterium]|nr:hypothetical protein [Actinomycetota bacterium]
MSEDVVAVRPSARRPPGFRLSPNLDELWIVVAVVLVAVVALLQAIQPYDFWWHIGTGRLIAAEHAIPQVDRFSNTQFGRPFYNQSWLAQVGLYAVHRAGGPQLTLLVKSLVVALAYALVLALTVRRCGGRRLAALVLILATLPVSFANGGARPQTLAYPVFAAFLYILTDFRLSRGGHRDVGEREAAARVGSPPAGGRWRACGCCRP